MSQIRCRIMISTTLLDMWRSWTHFLYVPTAGKRKRRRRVSAAVLSKVSIDGVLPVMELQVNGRQCRVLIDTGCTDNIVYSPVCTQWRPERVTVTTISGDPFTCSGKGTVAVQTPSGQHADVEVLVVSERPMGADMIIHRHGWNCCTRRHYGDSPN